MKRETIAEIAVFTLLVTSGAGLRIALQDLPNFAPVAAIALFAGYFFRSRVTAVAVPLAIMAISNYFIGVYAWYQMAVVYSMLALPVLMRGYLRRNLRLDCPGWKSALVSLAGLFSCSLAGSVLFFLATNAVCLHWYEPSLAGVAQCYWQALPFFRFTLSGDICFALVTFGSYALVLHFAHTANVQPTALPHAASA